MLFNPFCELGILVKCLGDLKAANCAHLQIRMDHRNSGHFRSLGPLQYILCYLDLTPQRSTLFTGIYYVRTRLSHCCRNTFRAHKRRVLQMPNEFSRFRRRIRTRHGG